MAKTVLFTKSEIETRITQVAQEIADKHQQSYPEVDLLVLPVLKSAGMIANDLLQALFKCGVDAYVEYIQVSSYGDGQESSRQPVISMKDTIAEKILGKHVVVAEDMVDTGLTLDALLKMLNEFGALAIEVFVLILKIDVNEAGIEPNYVGFVVNDRPWLEGHGIDTAGRGRGNPDIVMVTPDE